MTAESSALPTTPMRDAAPDALPADLRRLLDPTAPLMRPERFVPGGLTDPAGPFLWLLAGGAFGLGLFGAALYAWAGDEADPATRFVAPALAALAWGRAAVGWGMLKRARDERRAVDTGTWRRGLYVEDDGLLIQRQETLDWLPRGAIAGVEPNPIGHGVQIRLHDGASVPVDGPDQALATRLQTWLARGDFEWQRPR